MKTWPCAHMGLHNEAIKVLHISNVLDGKLVKRIVPIEEIKYCVFCGAKRPPEKIRLWEKLCLTHAKNLDMGFDYQMRCISRTAVEHVQEIVDDIANEGILNNRERSEINELKRRLDEEIE